MTIIENQNISTEAGADKATLDNTEFPKAVDSLPVIYIFWSPTLQKILLDFGETRHYKIGWTTKLATERFEQWRKEGDHYSDIELLGHFIPEITVPGEDGGDKHLYVHDEELHKALELEFGWKRTIHHFDRTVLEHKWSQEFYYADEDATYHLEKPEDIVDFLENVVMKGVIREAYLKDGANGRYKYLEAKDGGFTTEKFVWEIQDYFQPRYYQQRVINETVTSWKNLYKHRGTAQGTDNTDLLLYAPTRSGKCVMAMWSVKEFIYGQHWRHPVGKRSYKNKTTGHIIVVVSGMLDVIPEWKKTVEAHDDFAGINEETGKQRFTFMEKHSFYEAQKRSENAIDNALEIADNIVVAFSLQDLYGSTKEDEAIKFAHAQVQGRVSYVLSDEAHFGNFGARAYSAALLPKRYKSSLTAEQIEEIQGKGFELNPTYGRLFISATPVNILVDSDRTNFKVNKNVIQVSPSDIVKEQELWEKDNDKKPFVEQQDPSVSPYFGIPESHAFAVNYGKIKEALSPSGSKKKGMKQYTREDIREITRIFDSLFSPENGAIIAGIPNFAVNENITDRNKGLGVGKNIVIFLPFKQTCDMVEKVLGAVLAKYGIAEDYKIVNATGHDSELGDENIDVIKNEIENTDKKTITLTVRKGSTGVTVRKWDMSLHMDGGASIQQILQQAGRTNSPYVAEDSNGNKVVMKPYTVQIHFAAQTFFQAKLFEDKVAHTIHEQTHDDNEDYYSTDSPVYQVNTDGSLEFMSTLDIQRAVGRYNLENGIGEMLEDINIHVNNVNLDALIIAERHANEFTEQFGSFLFQHHNMTEEERELRCPLCEHVNYRARDKNGYLRLYCQACFNNLSYEAQKDAEREEEEQRKKEEPPLEHDNNEDLEQTEDVERREQRIILERRVRYVTAVILKLLLTSPRKVSIRTVRNALSRDTHHLHEYFMRRAHLMKLTAEDIRLITDFGYVDVYSLNTFVDITREARQEYKQQIKAGTS